MVDTSLTGQQAEALASRFLRRRGLTLLARNYRSRGGEIDLVMKERDSLVFVEVRYRRNSAYGRAAETVDARKQRRIVQCARHYLLRHRQTSAPARFDVVSIEYDKGRTLIDWVRDAFRV